MEIIVEIVDLLAILKMHRTILSISHGLHPKERPVALGTQDWVKNVIHNPSAWVFYLGIDIQESRHGLL